MTHSRTFTIGDREFLIDYQIEPPLPASFTEPGSREYIEIESISEIGPDRERYEAEVSDDELNAIYRELTIDNKVFAHD